MGIAWYAIKQEKKESSLLLAACFENVYECGFPRRQWSDVHHMGVNTFEHWVCNKILTNVLNGIKNWNGFKTKAQRQNKVNSTDPFNNDQRLYAIFSADWDFYQGLGEKQM